MVSDRPFLGGPDNRALTRPSSVIFTFSSEIPIPSGEKDYKYCAILSSLSLSESLGSQTTGCSIFKDSISSPLPFFAPYRSSTFSTGATGSSVIRTRRYKNAVLTSTGRPTAVSSSSDRVQSRFHAWSSVRSPHTALAGLALSPVAGFIP